MSATAADLRSEVAAALEQLRRTEAHYQAADRRSLIAQLLALLAENPDVTALTIDAQYEYDDEGSYFRCLSGWLSFAEGADDEDLSEEWPQDLDASQAAILGLFEIEETGEGSVTRVRVVELASQEDISCAP